MSPQEEVTVFVELGKKGLKILPIDLFIASNIEEVADMYDLTWEEAESAVIGVAYTTGMLKEGR